MILEENILKMRKPFAISVLVILTSVLFVLFSYTQIDLNLTLSRASWFSVVQRFFQQVGFFNRPLATGIYVSIVCVYFVLYGIFLKNPKHIWRIIIAMTMVLLFSYPATFSYDFFNYLFTAKTILVYGKNPYDSIPLQFVGVDPWLSFMRWTHLSSAYTPFWIGLSLLPYLAGFGYLLPTIFFTKIMIALFYIWSCYLIGKITKGNKYAIALFALNPLVVIETLISSHNDIVLVAFALLAIWYMDQKKYVSAWFFLSLSIAAKLMTLFLIPVFLLKKNKVYMLGAMVIGLVLVVARREFLPWYWVWIMPFIALLWHKRWITLFGISMSFGLILSYAPYFYFGHYNFPVPIWKLFLTWTPVCLVCIYGVAQVLLNTLDSKKR